MAESSHQIPIRFPTDVHATAKAEAKRHGWSLNTYTVKAVTAYTRHHARQRSSTEDTTP